LTRIAAEPTTRVAEIRVDRMAVRQPAVSRAWDLVTRAPSAADRHRLMFFLGRAPGGPAYLAVVLDDEPPITALLPPAAGEGTADEVRWETLRSAGLHLGDLEAGVFTTTLALANWHQAHTHCPRCGAPSVPANAGWTRRCTKDGTEHFPRTDPAVIMSVVDDADRLLLGRNPSWPPGRFSVLAGFVEPGESFEAAVVREVAEEVGIRVDEVRVLGSQPWPFPSSVMVGMTARAVSTELRPDPQEIAEAMWVTREEYREQLRSGRILTPSGISIALRLIEHWLGEAVAPTS
jgi:NAD+ diphosphatase